MGNSTISASSSPLGIEALSVPKYSVPSLSTAAKTSDVHSSEHAARIMSNLVSMKTTNQSPRNSRSIRRTSFSFGIFPIAADAFALADAPEVSSLTEARLGLTTVNGVGVCDRGESGSSGVFGLVSSGGGGGGGGGLGSAPGMEPNAGNAFAFCAAPPPNAPSNPPCMARMVLSALCALVHRCLAIMRRKYAARISASGGGTQSGSCLELPWPMNCRMSPSLAVRLMRETAAQCMPAVPKDVVLTTRLRRVTASGCSTTTLRGEGTGTGCLLVPEVRNVAGNGEKVAICSWC